MVNTVTSSVTADFSSVRISFPANMRASLYAFATNRDSFVLKIVV